MKHRKNRIRVIVLILYTSMLCGCAQTPGSADEGRTCVPGAGINAGSYNDRGVIRFDSSNQHKGIAVYFDPESGACAPLCTKINCSHEGWSANNPDPDCDAYLADLMDFAAIVGNALYYVGSNRSFREKEFWKADTNGANRKLLYRMDNFQGNSCAGVENGYLIYAYYNQYDENGEILDCWSSEVCLLDLENDKMIRIAMPDNYQGKILQATIAEDTLYYLYHYSTVSLKEYRVDDIIAGAENILDNYREELWKYDLPSGQKTCLWSKSAGQAGRIYLGYGYLYGDCFDNNGYLQNLSTGESYGIDPSYTENASACLSDEGAVIISDEGFWLWRFDTGELEALGIKEDTPTIMNCVTKNWVYVYRHDKDGNFIGQFYMSKDRFVKGDAEWKLIPEI